MGIDFKVHSAETAPAASRPVLEKTRSRYGMIPNLFGVLAESPAAVEAYASLSRLFGRSGLTPLEQHVVLQTHNIDNGCDYCAAAHSTVARGAGVEPEIDDALRNDEPLADARLEALRQFTKALDRERGWVGDEAVAGFIAAGFTQGNVFDVILGISFKRLSNYSNHVAATPLDAPFAAHAWQKTG